MLRSYLPIVPVAFSAIVGYGSLTWRENAFNLYFVALNAFVCRIMFLDNKGCSGISFCLQRQSIKIFKAKILEIMYFLVLLVLSNNSLLKSTSE